MVIKMPYEQIGILLHQIASKGGLDEEEQEAIKAAVSIVTNQGKTSYGFITSHGCTIVLQFCSLYDALDFAKENGYKFLGCEMHQQ